MGSLELKVERSEPELIAPAKPTPYELKDLSDIDDQDVLRYHIPILFFFKKNELMEGRDPVGVIKHAIAEALVYYYPLAGRPREKVDRKLIVECTGEGILFIEATANFTIEHFGESLVPPFTGLDQLLYDVPGTSGVVDNPPLVIQVTRLACGGFIFACNVSHIMCDGAGLVQFMKAVGELARGENTLSVEPVWRRELMTARDPPRITCFHHQLPPFDGIPMPIPEMSEQTFFFGPQEVAALRKCLPSNLATSTSFEMISACIWRCRTIAINLDPNSEMCLLCPINARGKMKLPNGYYGNGFVFSMAVAEAGKICENPFSYTLELVKKAKNEVTEEYVRSFMDMMVVNGRPKPTAVEGMYIISNVSRLGFLEIDFGWEKPVYGGPAKGDVGPIPIPIGTFLLLNKNNRGEERYVVPIRLPSFAMERFVVEMDRMVGLPK